MEYPIVCLAAAQPTPDLAEAFLDRSPLPTAQGLHPTDAGRWA